MVKLPEEQIAEAAAKVKAKLDAKENVPQPKGPERRTVWISDGSDRGPNGETTGLVRGQIITVTGAAGRWIVKFCHLERNGSRGYDIERLPGNRRERRRQGKRIRGGRNASNRQIVSIKRADV